MPSMTIKTSVMVFGENRPALLGLGLLGLLWLIITLIALTLTLIALILALTTIALIVDCFGFFTEPRICDDINGDIVRTRNPSLTLQVTF